MEEARRNEEREKREDEKGSQCFFKSWSSSIKIWFFQLIECIIKMSWCETECKNMRHW